MTKLPVRIAVMALLATLLLVPGPRAAGSSALQAPPQRIISLVPAVTEMLFAIGAGPRVVGVSSFDKYPPEAASRPRVGALIDPDFERILTLRPDLVIAYRSQDDLIGRLRRSSIPVFSYHHTGLADIAATIRDLGNRTGLGADAERVAGSIERDLARVRTAAANRPRPSVALIFSREPGSLRAIYASGGVGFLHDLLIAAGGSNVFGDVRRESLQASTEILLARAPEVIIEIRPSEGWTAERIARERSLWMGLPSVPAARNGRVHILADEKLSIPGPRVAEAAQAFFDALHAPRR